MNLDGHSKENLRKKGAAAVFRAACSIRRSTPRGAVGHVKYVVILYLSYPNLIYLRGPASAADPSALVRQNNVKNRS